MTAIFMLTAPVTRSQALLDELTRRDRIETLQRLATQAERDGVRILVDRRTGQHVAVEPVASPYCQHVDIAGCTCRHFSVWRRCGHWALFLAETGNIPDANVTVLVGDVIAIDAVGNLQTSEFVSTAERWAPHMPLKDAT